MSAKRISLIKRTSHTPANLPGDMEIIAGKSETVQNDAMSIEEMLRRVTEAKPVLEMPDQDEVDFDDPDLEKIKRADVNSQMRIFEEHKNKVVEAKKVIEEANNQRIKAEKEKEESERKEFEEYKKKKAEIQPKKEGE